MKSRNRRERRRAARGTAPNPEADQAATTRPTPPRAAPSTAPAAKAARTASVEGPIARLDRYFVPAAILIMIVAAALRLPLLDINPFHHDEGVNGFFTMNLVRDGHYAYNPQNFHGPSLYYFALVSETLFGLNDTAMRLVPVVCGLLTVALIFPLRRFLGPVATLSAAALLAVSPGAVYYSRYFIHEMLLVCFCLALVVSLLLYLDTRRAVYLVAAAASAALVFTTKETGIINLAVLAIAAGVATVYVRWRGPRSGAASARRARGTGGRSAAAGRRQSVYVDGVEYRAVDRSDDGDSLAGRFGPFDLEQLAGPVVVFVAIYVLLFSSFFTNFPQGLVDSLATFAIWTQTGGQTQVQPIQQYLLWMLQADAPILVIGAIGGVIAAVRGNDRLWVFIGLWALGTTVAYSLIAYKTPWIVLNMLVPLALLGGLTIDTIARSVRVPGRLLAPLALAVALAVSTYQALDLNFRHYADETYPYVFVHTTPDIFELLGDIDRYGSEAGTRMDTGVAIVSPDYWPLPWYLRDHPKAGFFGSIVATEEPMILANVNQEPDLGQYADRYTRTRTYVLRPGVELVLYVRKALAGG
jgi:uncharacterized protein (TIGR03663 family)